MARYRKKPVVIDAWQFRRGEEESDLAPYVVSGHIRYTDQDTILIKTLEGTMEAQPGDWIIRGGQRRIISLQAGYFRGDL